MVDLSADPPLSTAGKDQDLFLEGQKTVFPQGEWEARKGHDLPNTSGSITARIGSCLSPLPPILTRALLLHPSALLTSRLTE